jgi:hypothetical protein
LATDWSQNFKRLYERTSTSWRRLPAWVRGYGDELLRAANHFNGVICDSIDAEDIALLIFAHPGEVDNLRNAINQLVEQGFLTVVNGSLVVTNLQDGNEYKRLRDAERQKNRRETAADNRPTQSPANGSDCHTLSQPVTLSHVTSQPVTSCRPEKEEKEEIVSADVAAPTQAKSNSTKRPKERASRIADDWCPSEAHRSKAKELGVNCATEAEKFVDYCKSKGRTYTDWEAAFRNWLRNAKQFQGTNSPAADNGLPYDIWDPK